MDNSLLDDLLDEENQERYVEEDKTLEPLLAEINRINDQGIRLFVRTILLRAPLPFWRGPSSYSGKYHPPDEHGYQGTILHTKRTVRIMRLIAKAHDFSQHTTDILLAAALLHDITKGVEWTPGTVSYDPMHPYTVDNFVDWVQEEDQEATANTSSTLFIEGEEIQQILRLIRCHMGMWSPIPETVPLSEAEWALHMADYLASNLHIIVDGNEVPEWRWNPPEEE